MLISFALSVVSVFAVLNILDSMEEVQTGGLVHMYPYT